MNDLTCREGHSLTGDEKLDVTGTPKCLECKAIRRKDYKPRTKRELLQYTPAGYRRMMKDVDLYDQR